MIVYFILIVVVSWNILTRSYLNPYKLIMVFGKKGSGKTTFLTKQAIRHIKNGWTVYSNIYIPGTYTYDINDIGIFAFPEKSLVIIDEVGMIWDNRNFKEFKNSTRDYFKLQRQYKHKVIMTSQAFDIDKKLRDLTDEMYLLTNFLRVWSVCKYISKKIVIANNENGQGKEGGTLAEFYSFAVIPSFTFIPRWTKFFKSFNPKPLLHKEYVYQPMNVDEQLLMSSKYFWFTSIKTIVLNLVDYMKTKCKQIYFYILNIPNRSTKFIQLILKKMKHFKK